MRPELRGEIHMSSGLEQTGTRPEAASEPGRSELLGAVFDGLDEAGVRWALLRGRASLGEAGGDVDLLVSADDLDSFEDVVFELGAFVLPRLRMPGSWSRAVLRHPWHRFYVVTDPSSGARAKLDVVTRLVYNRRLRLESHLEAGCLERRRQDDGVWVLEPSDAFWTVLLHCLLDKQKVTAHRAAELGSAAAQVRRPSPGEEFFETLCPSGCSADLALSAARDGDWQALADLGGRIVRAAGGPEPDPAAATAPAGPRPAAPPRPTRNGAGVAPRLRRGLRAAAASAYPAVWRRAGLGAVPRVLDVLEAGPVDATVLRLRRRPAVCDVVVLVPEEQRAAAGALLRAEHYVAAGGRWHRPTGVGLERVRLVGAGQLGLPPESVQRLRDDSVPMAGRTRCRRVRGTGPWLDAVPAEDGGHAGH